MAPSNKVPESLDDRAFSDAISEWLRQEERASPRRRPKLRVLGKTKKRMLYVTKLQSRTHFIDNDNDKENEEPTKDK